VIIKENFLDTIVDCVGFDRQAFVEAHANPPAVSIRINPAKVVHPSLVLDDTNLLNEVPWCSQAFVLKQRPSFTLDPLFHAGAYYVQEASSMFLQHVVNEVFKEGSGNKALDLCAAPGGKTTLMAAMQQFGLIVSNEIIQSRVSVLQENVIKWGDKKVFVSNNDPGDFKRLPDYFDFVLVDAPCSGSGLFRKDEKAMEEWNPDLVDFCASRQKRILHAAMDAVADGGYLFYSTCSFSKEENEDNLDFIMASGLFESVDVSINARWGIVKTQSDKHHATGFRFYPDKLCGEGFFCAVLKKVGCSSNNSVLLPAPFPSVQASPNLLEWLKEKDGLIFYKKGEELYAIDKFYAQDVALLSKELKFRKSGLRLGELIRDEFVPNHELAMSTEQSEQSCRIELDLDQALRYLRRETLDAGSGQKGWSLVHYKGISMGWVKLVQGKAKNHYPLNWRILMRG
jgi:16S rRNA C967 or C1407 C5-methylase (RsmB/RsmF family)/NOL1/NOP2/fmu family ribosome biogenesis protein